MGTLRTGKGYIYGGWPGDSGRRHLHLYALVSHKLHTGAPVFSATPVSPEQRRRTNLERMEQHADLTRLFGGAALPLALFAQGTRTTTADAGCIHHAQTAIDFSTLLLDTKLLACWIPEGSVRLEGEIVA